MRVLFVSPLPPPAGGIATWTSIISKYGLGDGFGYRIVNSGLLPSQTINSCQKVTFLQLLRNVRILALQIGEHVCFRPHIVHVCTGVSSMGIIRDFFCLLIAHVFFSKGIVHFHRNLPDACNGNIEKMMVTVVTLITHQQIVLNALSSRYLSAAVRGANPVVLPNFIDAEMVGTGSHHKKEDGSRIKGIYCGHLLPQKGVMDIVSVAPEFPEIDFTLAGLMGEELQKLIHKKPGNVIILPNQNRSDLLALYSQYDFLLFLSHSEGFPYAVLEAMAAGLPIVGTRVGAVPEMVDEGLGGKLCEPGNLDSIKQAIRSIVKSSDRFAMGKHNRLKVMQQYTYDVIRLELLGIYEHLKRKTDYD